MKKKLSLDAFARAKKSTRDPRVEKEKERQKALRTIGKYKKIKKRLGIKRQAVAPKPAKDAIGTSGSAEEIDDGQKTGELTVRDERPAEARGRGDHGADVDAALKRRSQSKTLKKKTHRGQPLMKYRVEKLLGILER